MGIRCYTCRFFIEMRKICKFENTFDIWRLAQNRCLENIQKPSVHEKVSPGSEVVNSLLDCELSFSFREKAFDTLQGDIGAIIDCLRQIAGSFVLFFYKKGSYWYFCAYSFGPLMTTRIASRLFDGIAKFMTQDTGRKSSLSQDPGTWQCKCLPYL